MNPIIETNNIKELDEAIEASIKVYKPTSEDMKTYHNKKDWLNKIEKGGLLITAKVDGSIVGFSICYSNENTLHIWVVGVLEEYRRFGIWKQMYFKIIEHAVKNNYKQVTLNTYRNRFSGMYNFCLENGFKVYKTERDKSFFTKNI
jgi:ribosomal protein S18 acetylase RimI-like enzyme